MQSNGFKILATILFLVAAAAARAESPQEEKVHKAVNGQGYAHVIDDKRPNHTGPFKVYVGQVGVEYLLDGANVTVQSVKVEQTGNGAFNAKYKITMRVKLNGAYSEKHFRGVGDEYHTENEGAAGAEAEVVIETSPEIHVVKMTRLGGDDGRKWECLANGAKGAIAQAIKKVDE
jgi:hypothetical protein